MRSRSSAAVAVKVAELATTAFAMESIAFLVAHFADRPDSDIRLEAAAAKEWNTVRAWHLLDDILQIVPLDHDHLRHRI